MKKAPGRILPALLQERNLCFGAVAGAVFRGIVDPSFGAVVRLAAGLRILALELSCWKLGEEVDWLKHAVLSSLDKAGQSV